MKNLIYLIRREYLYKDLNGFPVGGPIVVWYSLQGWVDKRRVATFFSTKDKAESKALLLATDNPDLFGQLEIVRLTRPKGVAVDV